jgi:pyruvate dehydrogenase E2 component (dihydrolipoamide acetyltransferase)
VKLTYLPFLIKAVIPALNAHPYFNASLDEGAEAIVLKSISTSESLSTRLMVLSSLSSKTLIRKTFWI